MNDYQFQACLVPGKRMDFGKLMLQVEVANKSELADLFNIDDTVINNHFTLVHAHLCSCNRCKTVYTLHLMWCLDAT